MGRLLDDAQVRRFRRDGVVHPLRILDAREARRYLPLFSDLRQRMRGWSTGSQVLKSHLVSTWVCDLVRHPRILDTVEDLLGPDLLCWAATFFAKDPHTEGFVGWHHYLLGTGARRPSGDGLVGAD